MQIMIDTQTDDQWSLRHTARFLLSLVGELPAVEAAPFVAPDQTPRSSVAPAAPIVPVPPPPSVVSTESEDDADVDLEDDLPPAPPILAELTAAANGVPLPPGPPAAVEYDDAGMPWDARIHMDGRQRKLNGEWKNRKRLDAAVLTAVSAELEPHRGPRKVPEGTTAPLAPPPPPAPSVATAPAIATNVAPAAVGASPGRATAGAAVASSSTVLVPPAPNGAPPPPPAGQLLPSDGALAFRTIMKRISPALTGGVLTHDLLNAGLTSLGLGANQLTALAQKPQLIAPLAQYLDSLGVA